MHERVVLVALDINKIKDARGAHEARLRPGVVQIQQLENYIEAAALELKEEHPDSLWVFSWREYGLGDGGSQFVSAENRDDFLVRMTALSLRYPQVLIIGGMATTTHYDAEESLAVLKEVKENYRPHAWIGELEKGDMTESKGVFLGAHPLQQAACLIKIDTLLASIPREGIDVISNDCYFIKGGHVHISSKIAPLAETVDGIRGDHARRVFNPAAGTAINPIYSCALPNGDPYTIGVEYCRDNAMQRLERFCKAEARPQPNLHLLLSDQLKVTVDNIKGQHFVNLDSVRAPMVVLTGSTKESKEITPYYLNLLAPLTKLQRFEPFYPFECKINDELTKAMAAFPRDKIKHPKYKALESLKKAFAQGVSNHLDDIGGLCREFKKQLDGHKKVLEEKGSAFTNLFISKTPNAAPVVANLNKLLVDELKKGADYKDIRSLGLNVDPTRLQTAKLKVKIAETKDDVHTGAGFFASPTASPANSSDSPAASPASVAGSPSSSEAPSPRRPSDP